MIRRDDPVDHPLGDVLARVMGLLRGERELLDRQVEPDGERKGEQDPRSPEGQEVGVAALRRDVRQVVGVEVPDGRDEEHGQHDQGQEADDHREPEAGLHPDVVEAHEDDVEDRPPQRLGKVDVEGVDEDRVHVGPDADDDDRRRDHILHVLGQTGDVPAPGPHGGTAERVRPPGVGQGGRELGDGEAQPEVHDRDHARRDQQTPEPPFQQTEVPAEEVAGDDRSHPQRPQRPGSRVPTQAALVEVLLIGLPVRDRADRPSCFCHDVPLLYRHDPPDRGPAESTPRSARRQPIAVPGGRVYAT